jgi:hypothetical protein
MKRFVEGTDRAQSTLFPEYLEDWIHEDNPVRVIDVFVDELNLGELGFGGVDPEATGRPSYHPSVLLKLYVYGYLNPRGVAMVPLYPLARGAKLGFQAMPIRRKENRRSAPG